MQNKLLLKVISYQKLKKSILFQKMDSKLCYTFSRSCDVGYYIVSPGFSRGILFIIINTKCIYSKVCDSCNW